MTKQEIRQSMRRRIAAMSPARRAAEDAAIGHRLMASAEWRDARTVLLYAALPDEVDTAALIATAEAQGKHVVLPVVDGDDLLLRYHDAARMAEGRFHIAEPTPEAGSPGDIAAIDLAIIPGRAFTAEGLRLGRGRGYYDRLLPRLRCPAVGLAYRCQMADALPADAWDVPLQQVVTP